MRQEEARAAAGDQRCPYLRVERGRRWCRAPAGRDVLSRRSLKQGDEETMMAVQVYGCNHIVIEVTDAKKAVQFSRMCLA